MSDLMTLRDRLEVRDLEGAKSAATALGVDGLVEILTELEPAQQAVAYRLLDKDAALRVFESLPVEEQQSLIDALRSDEAVDVVAALEPDEAARLLDELPAGVAKQLLGALDASERDRISAVLRYPEDSAGRVANPSYVRVSGEATVAEALEAVRRSPHHPEEVTTVYVTDAQRRLLGAATLPALVKAEPGDAVVDHLSHIEVRVQATDRRADAARLLQQYNLGAIPVVDGEDRLVGSITYDDAIDVLEEETSQTMYAMAGLSGAAQEREYFRSERLTSGPILYSLKVRIPFLFVALAGGLAVGGLVEFWEGTLEALVALAFFVPVIMDMAGNVGTQSSTIFARGLALGHIDPKRFGPCLAREVAVGASMAVVFGLIGGVIAAVWQGIPELGLVVGLSLFAGLTIAAGLGFLLPWVLYKLGFDHAPGADPFITTIKDFTALAVYFALAATLIPQVG